MKTEIFYETKPKAQTCQELLELYQRSKKGIKGEKLEFKGVDGRDVYNITAPFEDEGELVIAGRVEGRNTEYSDVIFFVNNENAWEPRKNTRSFKLQDPFYTKINGDLIFGGVEVWAKENKPDSLSWRTAFYKGKNINQLELFAKGPVGMKDIRLIELQDGRISVFTRPQGDIGGRGQIGFTTINSIEDLNTDMISNAELINKRFIEEEWGGSNELHRLKNGFIGVLGHIACFDSGINKHYYSVVFSFNPDTREISPMKIIATRTDFEKGDAKRPDLTDAIFSGGLVRLGNGEAVLYAGVSDAEAHRILIPDPFEELEN